MQITRSKSASIVISHDQTGICHTVAIDRVRGDSVHLNVDVEEGWTVQTLEDYDVSQRASTKLSNQLEVSTWFNDAESLRDVIDHAICNGADESEILDIVRNPASHTDLYLAANHKKLCVTCSKPIDVKHVREVCHSCAKVFTEVNAN